ncbi:MAG: hypothetical protein ABIJ81_04335 [Patescibacteria group bacterium]
MVQSNYYGLALFILSCMLMGGIAMMLAPPYKQKKLLRRGSGLALAIVAYLFLFPLEGSTINNIYRAEENHALKEIFNQLENSKPADQCTKTQKQDLLFQINNILILNDSAKNQQQKYITQTKYAARGFIKYISNYPTPPKRKSACELY